MAKTEDNLKTSEEFIRDVLSRNFNQKIDQESLRAAAEKLCAALPERQKVAA
jgi:hypothetical protein